MQNGLIVKTSGSLYTVRTDEGFVLCRERGRLKLGDVAPVAGDFVKLRTERDGCGVITAILPRKNSLVRPPVANIDKLLIIASTAPPVTEHEFIDSLTVLAEYKGITPVICVNKTDLADGSDIVRLYCSLGYRAYLVSAATGLGIDDLRRELRGAVSVLAGNSGVGKSSLLNTLYPGCTAKTGELSEKIGRGRQTTQRVELYPTGDNGYIADTPGYSAFDAVQMEMTDAERLPFCFPEFADYLGKCRYSDCGHLKDDGCAIRSAAESGAIALSRYKSYQSLLEEMKNAPKAYETEAGKPGKKNGR